MNDGWKETSVTGEVDGGDERSCGLAQVYNDRGRDVRKGTKIQLRPQLPVKDEGLPGVRYLR